MTRRHWSGTFLLGAALLPLAGCGGTESDSGAYLRFTNATVDYASADFAGGGSKLVTSLANGGTTSNWNSVGAGDSQIALYSAGATSAKLTETRTLASDSYTSAIAYGSLATSIKFKYFEESNAAPSDGVLIRLFQAATGLGALDVYVSNESSLSSLSPTVSVTAFDEVSSFVVASSGDYRIRVTTSGNKSNVIFDTESQVSLSNKSVITLVVVPRNTGSLPNLLALPEKSGSVLLNNPLAS